MKPYTDQEEAAALTDGAFMLRGALAKLDANWGEDVAERMAEILRHAQVLEEMASCYEVAS